MTNTVKSVLLGIIAILTVILVIERFRSPAVTNTGAPLPEEVIIGPFEGMPLRFDGYYRNEIGDILYLIRFFPEGRVVSVNGSRSVEKDLPAYLVRETRGNPSLGLHNVPVSVIGDSLVFITKPEKGEIEYRGTVVSSSMVRFLRHSHINGRKQLMEYIFHPDTVVSQ